MVTQTGDRMNVLIEIELVDYEESGERVEVLRRHIPSAGGLPRVGDRMLADENWEPAVVTEVVWSETLDDVIVRLSPIDAEAVGPLEVARSTLHEAGWLSADVVIA